MSAARSPLSATLAWSGAVLLALGAWLAAPGPADPRGTRHVFLVDVSQSARALRPTTWRAAVAAEAKRCQGDAEAAGANLQVSSYGGGWGPDLSAEFWPWLPGNDPPTLAGTDLDLGLRWLVIPEKAYPRLTRVTVFGDGTYTGRDVAPFAASMAAAGVEVRLVRLPPAELEDLAVLWLPSPLRVRRGEPIHFEVPLVWWPAAPGARAAAVAIVADLSDGGRSRRTSVRLDLPEPAANDAFVPLRARISLPALEGGSGRLEVRVHLEGPDGTRRPDAFPRDDAATTEVLAEGTLAVGIAGEPGARSALRGTLGVVPDGLALFDVDPAGGLGGFDVLVSADTRWDEDTAAHVGAFVRAGSGWVELCGFGFASGVRPAASALVAAPDGDGPREIAVLVDASGSMAGEPYDAARAALGSLLELAPRDAGLSARFFSASSGAPIDLGRPGERDGAYQRGQLLDRLAEAPEPHGPTRLWAALDALLADEIEGSSVLAVLVSDGRDPERANLVARAARVRERLAERHGRLVVISAGADPDRELLGALAGGAEHVLDAGELRSPESAAMLQRLLARAAASGALREDVPIRLTHGVPDELVGPLADVDPPVLRRAVRARAAEGASAAWRVVDSDGDAALAVRRWGLGVAVGFAFLADAEWVAEPGGLRTALLAALRLVAPPAPDAQPRLVERAGELVLENVPPGAPAVVSAYLTDASGRSLGRVDLLGAQPGHDPLRERAAPLPPGVEPVWDGDAVRAHLDLLGVRLADTFDVRAPSDFARVPRVFEPPPPPSGSAGPVSGAPHPAAPVVLAAGLLALAWAALRGFFSRPGR